MDTAVLDHLRCSICTDIYTEPVSLRCQHTFCKRCLQRSLKAGHICCPECRAQLKETTFQTNRLIKNMADQLKLEEKEVYKMKMEQGRGARGADQLVGGTNFQISTLIRNMEDQLRLDDRSGQRESDHLRRWGREEDWLVKEASRLPNFRLMRNMEDQPRLDETTIAWKEEIGGQSRNMTGRKEGRGNVCREHSEILKLFCETDRQLICLVCKEGRDHRGHTLKPVREAQEDLKTKVESALLGIKCNIGDANTLSEKQKIEISEAKKITGQLKAGFRARFGELGEELRVKELEAIKYVETQGDVGGKLKNLTLIEKQGAEARAQAASLQTGLDITEPGEFLVWWMETGQKIVQNRHTEMCSVQKNCLPEKGEDIMQRFIDLKAMEKILKTKRQALPWQKIIKNAALKK